ncbi:AER395Wp [Eremothecium gossypii ATCC 10895]|uniref:AER395Wp n=1 Tax=Eremothecium gossypii (strain ATCC 10895 / CBS 109.51 / FGSC 9923 / NRRL Y-1056) TaxID=284811 RepID=Q755X3_EREGS|nr:AER395Wp [Eremothecium gossypii ATCC 10895]AAS53074.1 AER395Wp [Eremothecium gossypii ATCC 10895]AEY97383.1 FAER395Wp [Eremothecium gossypii FDAG1]
MDRNLHSSPPRVPDDDDDPNSSFSSSFVDDLQLHSEGSVVTTILDRRRARTVRMNPLSSPTQPRTIERYTRRARQDARDNRLLRNRGDLEQYVMDRQRQLSLQQLNEEAERHTIPEDELNILLEEEPSLASGCCSPPPSVASVSPSQEDGSDDDAEIIRMLEQREEYERWVAAEQEQIEKMMESFNLG